MLRAVLAPSCSRSRAPCAIDRGRGICCADRSGQVRAKHVVLACDALLGSLEPRIAGHIMPVASYLVATAPLENPTALIADNLAVSDSKFVVNYFRLSADGRLIFAGGERYTPDAPADIAAFERAYLLKVFPQARRNTHRLRVGRVGFHFDVAAAACGAHREKPISRTAIPARAC